MDETTRRRLIDRYREGPAVLHDAVAAAQAAGKLDAAAEGGWTPRQIAHHSADSEMTSAIRLRRLLAEPAPQITGYDEEEFARRLYYERRPVEASLAAVRAARETTAEILEHLGPEEWTRAGSHSEMGEYSVERWLEVYAEHCHDHAAQARRAAGLPPTSGSI